MGDRSQEFLGRTVRVLRLLESFRRRNGDRHQMRHQEDVLTMTEVRMPRKEG